MQELLVDELTGDSVILAPARALRPDAFRVQGPAPLSAVADCPFCAGNEAQTPPEVARVGPGAPDAPGWKVRVIPNKFPIVGKGVAGAHEVLVLSPADDAPLAMLDPQDCVAIGTALRDRTRFHLEHGKVAAIPFVNHGKAAGASLAHPHAELIALEFVPPRVQARLDHYSPGALKRDREHIVLDGDAVVWAPVASTTPFSLRCALREPGPRFDLASDDEVRAVSIALSTAMQRLHDLLGDASYNLNFETAPRDDAGPFAWWIDIVPRIGVAAGFELGSGIFVNVVPPADAAAVLRDDS